MINNYNEIEISIPKPPSLNQLYAGKFWTFRHREKEKYFNGLATALEGHDKWSTDRFAIHLRYNSKFDVDNSVVAVKFLADYLRYNGYVIDDTPKHFLELRITFDAQLKKDEYLAKIICYNYNLIQQNNNDIRATKPGVLHSDIEDFSGERGAVRRPTRPKRKPSAGPKAGKRDNK